MYVETGLIKVVFKYYPVIDLMHSRPADESHWAAYAAECANEQGRFWEYHDKLFEEWQGEYRGTYTKFNLKGLALTLGLDTDKFNQCLDLEKTKPIIDADIAEAGRKGIAGTPSFILNGNRIPQKDLFQAVGLEVQAPSPTPSPTPASALLRAAMSRASGEQTITQPNVTCNAQQLTYGQFFCQDGERHIINTSGVMAGSITQGKWQNLVIQAEMRSVGTAGSYGIAFRGQSNSSGYYIFRIRAAGEYEFLMKALDQSLVVLQPWTPSPLIRKGELPNQLQAIADGAQLSLFANGDLLVTIADSTFFEGYVGYGAMEGGHVAVPSMKVWTLP